MDSMYKRSPTDRCHLDKRDSGEWLICYNGDKYNAGFNKEKAIVVINRFNSQPYYTHMDCNAKNSGELFFSLFNSMKCEWEKQDIDYEKDEVFPVGSRDYYKKEEVLQKGDIIDLELGMNTEEKIVTQFRKREVENKRKFQEAREHVIILETVQKLLKGDEEEEIAIKVTIGNDVISFPLMNNRKFVEYLECEKDEIVKFYRGEPNNFE